jgi:hypothetical protein
VLGIVDGAKADLGAFGREGQGGGHPRLVVD